MGNIGLTVPVGYRFTSSDHSLFYYYRQNAAKRQTACIRFTRRPKISILIPEGRLVAYDSREILHDQGARGSAWPHEISGSRGGNAAPKMSKISTFGGKESPRPLDWFLKFYGLLCAQLSCISVSNLTWFASQVTELLALVTIPPYWIRSLDLEMKTRQHM